MERFLLSSPMIAAAAPAPQLGFVPRAAARAGQAQGSSHGQPFRTLQEEIDLLNADLDKAVGRPVITSKLRARLRTAALAISAAAFVLLHSPVPVNAAVFPCTEAGILNAIATGGGPHTFACAGPTTVTTSAEIVIDNDVILDGEDDLMVDGNDTHRVFFVETGVTAELWDLTVTGGFSVGDGGGILNLGTLTVENSTVTRNSANRGGGIWSSGTLTLSGSTVSQSHAGRSGGGIGNVGILTVTDSVISDNTAGFYGGGIVAGGGGQTTVTDSEVTGNEAPGGFDPQRNRFDGAGGGIAVFGGTLTLANSIVAGNATGFFGGGLGNYSSTSIVANSTISGNTAGMDGGGIQSSRGGMGLPTALTVTDSTISGNTSPGGAGIGIVNVTLAVANSTISGNTAAVRGGGILNRGAVGLLTLSSSTLSGNTAPSGEDLSTVSFGTSELKNTLIDGACEIGVMGVTVLSMGGNVESPGDTCAFTDPTDQANVPPAQLALGPLQDNGGPTQTHALLPGSVAIDAAVDCPPPDTDQRGVSRPQGAACDSGAYESAPPKKVTLCHKRRNTISVGAPAVPAHQRHGDTLGACL